MNQKVNKDICSKFQFHLFFGVDIKVSNTDHIKVCKSKAAKQNLIFFSENCHNNNSRTLQQFYYFSLENAPFHDWWYMLNLYLVFYQISQNPETNSGMAILLEFHP